MATAVHERRKRKGKPESVRRGMSCNVRPAQFPKQDICRPCPRRLFPGLLLPDSGLTECLFLLYENLTLHPLSMHNTILELLSPLSILSIEFGAFLSLFKMSIQ